MLLAAWIMDLVSDVPAPARVGIGGKRKLHPIGSMRVVRTLGRANRFIAQATSPSARTDLHGGIASSAAFPGLTDFDLLILVRKTPREGGLFHRHAMRLPCHLYLLVSWISGKVINAGCSSDAFDVARLQPPGSALFHSESGCALMAFDEFARTKLPTAGLPQ